VAEIYSPGNCLTALCWRVKFAVKKKLMFALLKREGEEIALKISRYFGLDRASWIGNYVSF
jgi:hypothetical protein